MKIWVVKNEYAAPERVERYPAVAKELGVDVEVVDVDQITLLQIKNSRFLLQKDGAWLDQKKYPDIVIVTCKIFGSDHVCQWSKEILVHLEAAGVLIGNNVSSKNLADNKWQTHQKLLQVGIPTPNTELIHRVTAIPSLSETFSFPVVIKTVFGSKGKGVFLCNSLKEFQAAVLDIPYEWLVLAQDYLQNSHGRDVRVLVVGDRVVAAMKRTAAKQQFKANLDANGTGMVFSLTKEQEAMAIKASKALGLYYAGVDLLFKSDTELVVGEVNANPGLGIEKITGINVPAEICKHLLDLAKNKKK